MLFNQPRKKKINRKRSPWFTSVICQVTFRDVLKGNEEAEARNTYRQAVISASSWKNLLSCKYLHFWFSTTVVYQVCTCILFVSQCTCWKHLQDQDCEKGSPELLMRWYLLHGLWRQNTACLLWREGTAWARLAWHRSQGNGLLSQPDYDSVKAHRGIVTAWDSETQADLPRNRNSQDFWSVLAWPMPRPIWKKYRSFYLSSSSTIDPLLGSFYFIFRWLEQTGTSHEFNFCGCVYQECWEQGTSVEPKWCNPVPREPVWKLLFIVSSKEHLQHTSNNFTEGLQSASLAQFYTAGLKTWSRVRTLVAFCTTHHNRKSPCQRKGHGVLFGSSLPWEALALPCPLPSLEQPRSETEEQEERQRVKQPAPASKGISSPTLFCCAIKTAPSEEGQRTKIPLLL